MTNMEFIDRLKQAANSKTLYVMGCFGAPLNKVNKNRYINQYAYNQMSERKAMIQASSSDTFGFDCVCLVKGILWGWNGNKDWVYGGASYESNGVPDTTIENLLSTYCTDQSTDFGVIVPGEYLTMDGHCGVYIGDGLAIESTPKWKNGVQVSEVWNIKKTSDIGRVWEKHGKLKAVNYLDAPTTLSKKVIMVFPSGTPDSVTTSARAEIESFGYIPQILTM